MKKTNVGNINFFKVPMPDVYEKYITSTLKRHKFNYIKVELEARMLDDYTIDEEKFQEFIEKMGYKYGNFDDDDVDSGVFNFFTTVAEKMIKEKIGDNDLKFIKSYEDGSVGPEVTFTVPIERLHDVGEIAYDFYSFAEKMSKYIINGHYPKLNHIKNAGMHISIMHESTYQSHFMTDEDKQQHRDIAKSINSLRCKTQAALLFLSSSTTVTRTLNYRLFETKSDDGKYSSIFTPRDNTNLIEFRMFDPLIKKGMFTNYMYTIAKIIELATKKITEKSYMYKYLQEAMSCNNLINKPRYINTICSMIQDEDKIKLIDQLVIFAPSKIRKELLSFKKEASQLHKNTIIRKLSERTYATKS